MKFASKLWNEYGIGGLVVLAVVVYGFSILYTYLKDKGSFGLESNASMPQQYKAPGGMSGVQPSEPLGQSDQFASANGLQTSTPGMNSSCAHPNTQNTADLLPKDTSNAWAQANPTGAGDLNSISLLKAGHHIGIDTVGTSMKNANQQLRSEPPNPQVNTGPWNASTVEPDFMRPPLEIGSGAQ